MAGLNSWLLGAAVLMAGLLPCGIVCVRKSAIEGVAALNLATVMSVTALMLLAKGFHRPSFFDLAITLALMSVPGTLLFVYYLERWR